MYSEDHERRSAIPLRPVHTNTFALPEDDAAKLAHAVYDPADESLLLKSEKGRTIFAEAFITNRNLGTLSDLCMRALARENGGKSLDMSVDNHLQRRLQLDAIDVDQPLEDIYRIDDKKFWKRIALAKTVDAGLKLKDDQYDWKAEGVTLKYLELVENCPAEYWPEEKMFSLALKIKNYVTNMNIRKLQPLKDFSFEHYRVRDSDTDKTTSTEVSDTTEDEIMEEQEIAVEEEEEEPEVELKSKSSRKFSGVFSSTSVERGSQWSFLNKTRIIENDDDLLEKERLQAKVAIQTERRREDRRKRRESQQKRRNLREEKHQKRDEERNKPKPKRIKIKDIFNLPIDEPEDDEHKRQDGRNIESHLKSKKMDIYQPDRCHHIDLSFLRHFENLVSFQIKFQPPELKTKYHSRYFNFSHDDIKNLANGIISLENLRIFRLRDSRMDEEKLATLIFALNQMQVEVVDLGNDQIDDDCEMALQELFQNTRTIKSIELEGNNLGLIALKSLGRAIKSYGGKIEYLGLARNNMGADGLHALVSKIAATTQVESLSLAGIQLSEMAMLCCISDELLHQHKVLRHLNIMGSPLSLRSGELLLMSIMRNFNVLNLDCRGCNLNEDIEMDIEVCLQRNRFKAANPFLGDKTKTENEINESVNRIKNPILLAANERIEKRKACMAVRPDIAQRFSPEVTSDVESSSSRISNLGLGAFYRPTVAPEFNKEDDMEEMSDVSSKFLYNVMDFDLKQFHEHVHVPGPGNRYYYFKAKNNKQCQNFD